MEKIDIHDTERSYELALKKLNDDEVLSSSNKKFILKFLSDSAIGRTAGMKSRIKSVGMRARLKNLYLLKNIGQFYGKKDFKELSVKDIENFIHALEENKVKKNDNSKYSEQTKSNMKKILKLFLRWVHGEGSKKYHDMTYWIDTRFKKKTVPSLTEKEIKEVLKKCNTIKQKVLIACLFDGGFRIEEFLNIRNVDVKLVGDNAPYYRFLVRNEFSKTEGREVSMIWSESYDLIKSWMDLKRKEQKSDEPFFDGTYDGIRRILKKIGDRAGFELHAHKFRHSSSTFYANKGLNEFQLNKRYGWSSNSDMGRHYVDHAQIEELEGKQIKEYEDTKIEDLRNKLRKQEESNNTLKEDVETMKRLLSKMLEKDKDLEIIERKIKIKN